MKKPFLVMLSLFVSFQALAQENGEPEAEHFLLTGAGYSYTSQQDRGMSPLIYSGHNILGQVSYLHETDRKTNTVEVLFWYGNLTNSAQSGTAAHWRGMANFSRQYELLKFGRDRYEYWLGGAAEAMATLRQHQQYTNNSENYEMMASLAMTHAIARPLTIKQRNIDIALQLEIPLIAWVIRPSFSNALPPGYLVNQGDESVLKKTLESGRLASFNDLVRVKTSIGVTWHLKNKNAFRLEYSWDFYHYDNIEVNRVSSGFHNATFSTLYHF